MSFGAREQRCLTAAEGYIDLGMFQEANEELEQIAPDCRHLPEVLVLRLQIYQALESWELMQTVAKKLASGEPDKAQWWVSLAYATRRVKSVGAAKAVLTEAVDRFPRNATVHYNLACYECQAGDLDLAKEHIKKAFVLDEKCRMPAMDDPDLKPLWDSMQTTWP